MDELQEYEVEIGGVTHTMLLTEEEAQQRGAKLYTPSNKAGGPSRRASNDDISRN